MSLTKPRMLVLLALLGIPAVWFLTTGAYGPEDDTASVTADLEFEGGEEPPIGEEAWAALEDAVWFAEGSEDPKRVVYVFLDPQCPYCNLLWRASLPYLEEGLQVRNIVVAYLTPESTPQAAAILSSDHPQAIHAEHQQAYKQGGIQTDEASEAGQRALEVNNALFAKLDIPATPAIYFRDETGEVQRVIGFPELSMLATDVFRMPELPQTDPALAHYQ